jgi:glutathione S-transferase
VDYFSSCNNALQPPHVYRARPAAHVESTMRAPIKHCHRVELMLSLPALPFAFVTGDEPTIAEVAVYSYTALAPERGVALEPYPALRAWLTRMEALPGFLPVQRSVAT